MSGTRDYYREQAAKMRNEAEETALDNVRDRCLRSALAWDLMADRAERGERMRAELAARKEAGLV